MLVNMDGGLPLGTGHDRRTPEQFAENIARYTSALRNYPALYGWAWVANWWLYEQDAKFASPDEKAAYEAALKVVRETGRWDPILDRVDDRKIRFAVDAQELFNRELRKVGDSDNGRFATGPADRAVADAFPHPQAATRSRLNERAPRFRTASSGPYRRPEVYPPVNFANVDEVDVHYQAEQIATPGWAAHGIDYLRQPGKPVWGHPELFNDSGTGEQILPALWSMVMHGADGVGTAGLIPHWENVPSDPRGGYHGTVSVFRAVHEVLRQYGPWLTTLNSADRVAIVVSPRQLKTETFCEGLGSLTFSRQFEAYQSCLYAHRPATFVFAENLRLTATPGTLRVACAEPIVTLDAAGFAGPMGLRSNGTDAN